MIVAFEPGMSCAPTRNSSALFVDLDLLADAPHHHRAGLRLREQRGGGAFDLVARPGDRVAVRAGRGVAEQRDELLLDVGRDRVLPAVGLLVDLLPLEPDDVDEQPLGEPVAADDGDGDLAALRREPEACGRRAARRSRAPRGGSRSRRRPARTGRAAPPGGPGSASCLLLRSPGSLRGTPRWRRGARPRPLPSLSAASSPYRRAAATEVVPPRRRAQVPRHGFAVQNLHSRPASANMVSTRCL